MMDRQKNEHENNKKVSYKIRYKKKFFKHNRKWNQKEVKVSYSIGKENKKEIMHDRLNSILSLIFYYKRKKEKGSFDQILHKMSFITRISMSGRIWKKQGEEYLDEWIEYKFISKCFLKI